MERWKCFEGNQEGVHSWAPPGKLAGGRVKRWRRRRVSHNTNSPTTSQPSISASTCFRVSGCQAAGWLGRKAGVGWWPLLLISGLPVSASCSCGQPCPRQPAPVSSCQHDHSRNPQPGAVWKAQQRRQPPLPRARRWTSRGIGRGLSLKERSREKFEVPGKFCEVSNPA